MNVDAYLERIDYRGPRSPSIAALRALHVAHLMTVPFENLSIHSQEPIVLHDTALYEKIVARRRGGFCYELNGLFSALLRALGFDVTRLSATVMNDEGQFGPAFDHMTLMVKLDERWLADVGFGDCFVRPLRLDSAEAQVQGRRRYRIDLAGKAHFLWQQEGNDPWRVQYRFDLTPYEYDDFAEMCHYHQTSPLSHFTQRRVCSRATPEGRITLRDRRLIRTRHGERQEEELADEAAFTEALQRYFSIHLDETGGNEASISTL
jgi:N-hydroxyarylamine O-acetyltransferase